MTALADARMGTIEAWSSRPFTLASGTKAYKGAAAFIILGTSTVAPGTSTTGRLYIGTFNETVDATSAAKTVSVQFDKEIVVRRFVNATSTDAVAATDIGKECFFLDDQTVTITPTGRVRAGRVWGLAASGEVQVEYLPTTHPTAVGGTLAFASNDCVVTAAQAISGAVYDVPTTAAASTITLPVTGVADGTSVVFVADATKNGHTVQYRFGTTNITTALTASKIHRVEATKLGSGWGCTAYVSP